MNRIFTSALPLAPFLVALTILTGSITAEAAATLSGTVNITPPAPANLTTAGTLDWVIWGDLSAGTASSKAPVNDKAGGATILGNLTEATGGLLRGGIASTQTFSFTDGTSPTSASGATYGLIFASTLDTVGSGVQLSVAGDPLVERVLQIWASGANGNGTFTASLNGATPVVLTGQTYGSTKTPTLFTINYQPNVVGDLLTVKYVLATDTGSNSHVGFTAAAVSSVPEPVSTLFLLGGAGLLLARRRR